MNGVIITNIVIVVVVTVLLLFLVVRIDARTKTKMTTTFVLPYGKIQQPTNKNNFVVFSSSSSSSSQATTTNKQYTTTTTTSTSTSTSTSKSNSSNNDSSKQKKKVTTKTIVDLNKDKNNSNDKSRKHSKTRQSEQQQQQQRKFMVKKHSNSLVQSQPNEQQQQYQRLPLPDIQTQLQYSRNGHAVLRNLFASSSSSSSTTATTTIGIEYLSNLRTILYQYSQEQQLKAWQQKVGVAFDNTTNSANNKFKNINPNTIQTIDECYTILIQLGIPANKLPFLQYFNCWRTIPQVHTVCTMLSEIAALLLDVESVRLYQDSLFYKRCSSTSTSTSNTNTNNINNNGDGPTPWHTDCKMCPFDTSNMITFWIPLQYIPKDGSGLQFCSKTHNDFALPYWNTQQHLQTADQQEESTTKKRAATKISQRDRLEERYMNNGYINYIDNNSNKNKHNNKKSNNNNNNNNQEQNKQFVNYMPLNIGDLTVHSGWTLHCADPCSTVETKDRLALAISYVDSRAPVRYDAQQSVVSLLLQTNNNNKNNDNKRKLSTTPTTTTTTITTADREDIWSYQDWVTQVPHDTFEWDHPLVPILWPPPPSS